MVDKSKKKFRFDISIWVAASAIIVLAVIAAIMTLAHFQRQQEQAVTLFIEKGATLMQTFEAGLRDRPKISEDTFPLRKLLMETAQQPDIDYMILTDEKGMIIADSDPSMLGQQYGLDLDLKNITANREIHWRQVANPEGAGTFEVYRSFSPQERVGGEEHSTTEKPTPQQNNFIIYVGFNMAKIEQAGHEDKFRTVIIALFLVLIGSLAIVSLFLVQAYRLARSSLSRITVFSEALVKHMPIALLALDKGGRIVVCNEQAHGLFAGSCAEFVGQEAAVILPAALSQLLGKVHGQTDLVEEDIPIFSEKDGEQMWEVVAAAFANEDVHEGKILLARNVTAIRHLEQEVARSRHLNAIGSLAAGVAHEIRNPLSSIKGFAVYFKQRLSGNPEDEETADIMIAETERLNRVISQLIEFARPQQLKKEQTNIMDLVRHTIRLVNVEVQKNAVEIDVKTAENLPQVDVDPDKIKQVLLNIFLNALAAMPNGGRLSVALETQKDFLEVAVSDTGSGIEVVDLPRIYDPYFTSKPVGTGLGLAVVQKIMDAHGGKISVESIAGEGTKVFLHFPLTTNHQVQSRG